MAMLWEQGPPTFLHILPKVACWGSRRGARSNYLCRAEIFLPVSYLEIDPSSTLPLSHLFTGWAPSLLLHAEHVGGWVEGRKKEKRKGEIYF